MRSGSHVRRTSAVVMLASLSVLGACGDKPSKAEAERLITQYAKFKIPKTVRVPKRIVVAPGYGNFSHSGLHLRPEDWQQIDWVTHSLDAGHYVSVVDNARPSASSSTAPTFASSSNDEDGPTTYYRPPSHEDTYEHYIDVRLTPDAEQSGDFVEDDDDPEPGFYNLPSPKTPGWKLVVARRKLEGIVEILDFSATTETVLRGNAVAYFDFRWVPTTAGSLFDQGSDAFAHLDQASWANARQMMKLDSRVPQRAKVYFNRVEKGRWIVKGMECGRCGYFDDHP
jgi:hypothetical protein